MQQKSKSVLEYTGNLKADPSCLVQQAGSQERLFQPTYGPGWMRCLLALLMTLEMLCGTATWL